MKNTDKQSGKSDKRKKVFKNFAEYWHFTKCLSESQRKIISDSLSKDEQRHLRNSYNKGGWKDLFMRNACDEILDKIKLQNGVDVLQICMEVRKGQPKLVEKKFWTFINNLFIRIPYEHITYIFGNISVSEYDEEYVKLIKK
jgi:hypothetical protein